MRQTLWTVFLAAIVCAVTVGLVAQAPSSSAPQAGKQLTFSGCIEKAPSESSESPAAPAGSAATKFILTNASPAGTGAVGTGGSAKPAPKYRLDVEDAKISAHVGHKVEVTGTVEEQPASATLMSGPKLKVDSVKMVAAACP